MRKLPRLILYSALLLLIAAAGVGGYIYFIAGDEGTTELERWIGEQVRAAAGQYLNPRLLFDDPDYQAPDTVIVTNLRLTAPDPAAPGRTVDILHVDRATLRLGQIPRIGEPLHIEDITLTNPRINVIAAAADDLAPIGFSNLLRERDDESAAPKEPVRLTDVFRIRNISIRNGAIVIDPRRPDGKHRMELAGINTRLIVEPDEEGWYDLSTSINRAPLFDMHMAGRFNLNTAAAELASLSLDMTVGGAMNKTLPADLQRILEEHQVSGRLTIRAKGVLHINDWLNSQLEGGLELTDGNITVAGQQLKLDTLRIAATMDRQRLNLSELKLDAFIGGHAEQFLPQHLRDRVQEHHLRGRIAIAAKGGADLNDIAATATLDGRLDLNDCEVTLNEYMFQLERLAMLGVLDSRVVTLRAFEAEMLGGAVRGRGTLNLADAMHATLFMRGEGLRIHQLLKAAHANPAPIPEPAPGGGNGAADQPSPDAALPFRGKLDFELDLNAPLTAWQTQSRGRGTLDLTEGRLTNLGMAFLEDETAKLIDQKSSDAKNPGAGDKVHADFTLEGDRAEFTGLRVNTTLFNATGGGDVHLDGRLDLKLTGRVSTILGNILGLASDHLLTYHVTGTVSDPQYKNTAGNLIKLPNPAKLFEGLLPKGKN